VEVAGLEPEPWAVEFRPMMITRMITNSPEVCTMSRDRCERSPELRDRRRLHAEVARFPVEPRQRCARAGAGPDLEGCSAERPDAPHGGSSVDIVIGTVYIVYVARGRHPHKEIEKALKSAEDEVGFEVVEVRKGHVWGRVVAPNGQVLTVWNTRHAAQRRSRSGPGSSCVGTGGREIDHGDVHVSARVGRPH